MKEQAHKLRNSIRDLAAIASEMESHECGAGRQMLIHITRRDQHNIALSPWFRVHEFASKDGAVTVIIHKELLDRLNDLRELLDRPIRINSGYRTPEHNAAVGGATQSKHLEGMAADIVVDSMTPDALAVQAEAMGFRGIGIYRNFVHVDVRETPAKWRG